MSRLGRIEGDDAPRWIAERIRAPAPAGSLAGVIRPREVAQRYDRMLSAALQWWRTRMSRPSG